MPYGAYTPGTAGEEVSSTYEGRHLTFSESQLTHPSHTDGYVDKGDPVLVGENIVGVAFKSAAAATDLIAIDTEGIWQLSVVATDEDGNSAVAVGDELFINKTTCIISKNSDKGSHQRFGYALYPITSGDTDVIPVKVHWNPDDELELVGYSGAEAEISVAVAREYRYSMQSAAAALYGEYMRTSVDVGDAAQTAIGGRNNHVVAKAVANAYGRHDTCSIQEDGSITGLAVGHRAGLLAKDAAHAGGTIAGGMSELWANGDETDYTDYTMHSIHRFVNDGDATGKATAQNVFEFAGLSATQYAANTDTPDHALRVIINGNVRYIMVSEAQS
jgi:hypothetical protein